MVYKHRIWLWRFLHRKTPLILQKGLKAAGNVASFQPVHEDSQQFQENAGQMLAVLDAFDGMK